MAEIGIMIEGQEGLTWERFFKIAEAVEELGFASLFRSDHLTALEGSSDRPTLALWPSLTALALRTERIRFGPMVSPMTFRHPADVAMMAAAVDRLSKGRLDLGLGAGWFSGEHKMFGLDYPPYKVRLEMLDEGVQVIKGLWSGQPFSFQGKHYQLDRAESHPGPVQADPVIIMGGKGEKNLMLVARHASEWNFSYMGVEIFREKSKLLDQCCRDIGRDPADLRRSLMIPFVIGRDDQAVQERIDAQRRTFPSLPSNQKDWLADGFLGGQPGQLIDQMKEFADAGVQRFMLHHNDLDDLASLSLLSETVLPDFH